jgi:transcriptional regulator with XRE-family HTH domain
MTERQRRRLTSDIRRAIETSRISRYEIARRSGVTQASLSRFMAGKTSLTLDTIEKLAPVLGLEITAKKKR